jgi:hypothetical protein
MIPVKCRTNRDAGRTRSWPTAMCCRPEVGDTVEAKDGFQLKVCQITHATRGGTYSSLNVESYLIVELT